MIKRNPMLLTVVCILLTVLPRTAAAQVWTNPITGLPDPTQWIDPVTGEIAPIWMTSTLESKGDGYSASVDCKTSAQNPSSPFNVALTATSKYYGLGTVCNV